MKDCDCGYITKLSKEGVRVGANFYPHDVWRKFTFRFMRTNMSGMELEFWCCYGKELDKRYRAKRWDREV